MRFKTFLVKKYINEYYQHKNYYDNLLKNFESNQQSEILIEYIFERAKNIDERCGPNIMFVLIVRSDCVRSSTIKIMIELGVDPDCYVEALYYCFRTSDMEFSRYLICDLGIDANNCAFEGILSEYLNKPVLIKLLLDNGFDLTNNICFTSEPELIELLLDNGIELENIVNSAFNVNLPVADFLIDRIKNFNGIIEQSNLNRLLMYDHPECQLSLGQIKVLVDAGANPRCQNDRPFIISCGHDNIDIIKYYLYECGSDINTDESFAIVSAIDSGQFNIVKFLVENGINITDRAIFYGFRDIQYIKIFIDNGISPELIGKIFWEKIRNTDMGYFDVKVRAKELIGFGVDFNQIMMMS